MAKSFLTDINLNRNVLLNAKIQAWGSAPTGTGSPDGSGAALAGQISSYLGDLYIFTGASGTPANTWSRVGNTLSDSTSTTSSTTGASSTAVKAAYDLANAALPKAGGTMTGVIAMGTNNITGTGSISATTFTGALTGNASTATTLATARTINGVSFNGSANITVTAANPNALTIGTGLSGTSYDGSTAVTIAATAGSTSAAGILQLSDAINSTSTSLAATANAAKTAYDRGSTGVTNAATAQSTADAALPKAGGTMTGVIAMGNNKITGLGTPTADADAVTKLYVDTIATGLHVHPSVNYATTGALGTTGNLVGGTITTTYANGTSGVDATLTIATSSNWTAITIDGQSLTVNDRVLIKNQGGTASNLQNGIYFVTQVGAVGNTTSFIFKRALDADQSPEIDAGDLTYVVAGTANGGDGYVQVVNGVTVGTTAIEWSQFSGTGAVPLATVTSPGIASFPTAQFSVSAGGAVTIGTLNQSTTGSAATLTTSRTLWGQSFNGSANVTGALTGATTVTGTAATNFNVQAADHTGTSGQGPHTYVRGSHATAATGTAQGGNVYIWAGASDSGSGTTGSVNIGSGENVNITGLTTVTGTVRLPSVQSGSAGFVKIAATTGQLSTASIVYTDLPTNVGVVARKVSLVGTGSGTTIALTHGLGNNLVTAQVYDTSTSTATLVEVDITVTSTTATATFATTTTLSNYTLVVIG